jgi:hypothetical protein
MYVPPMADAVDLCRFHSKDYIDFISRVTPHNLSEYEKFLQQYNVMEDWYGLGSEKPVLKKY